MDEKLLIELESLGESSVRDKLARAEYGSVGSRRFTEVAAWLDARGSNREASNSARAIAIAERANEMASSALDSSRRQARYAMYAAVVATIALAMSIREEILALIFKST